MTHQRSSDPVPGLTACVLCAGETLGEADSAAGGQLQRLRRLAAGGAVRLTTVECLDRCERGDVVVARPSPVCRASGALPVWFEQLAGEAATSLLGEWLRAGGPGAAPLPTGLARWVVDRAADASDTAEP